MPLAAVKALLTILKHRLVYQLVLSKGRTKASPFDKPLNHNEMGPAGAPAPWNDSR
jgi:hypothetical protein